MSTAPLRVPSLDGLRALAVSTVIFCHLAERRLLAVSWVPYWDGVELFFVLSGFLITSILLRDIERDGSLPFGRFYIRRAFRILPPVLVYLVVVVGICLLRHAAVPWIGILNACLFTSGVLPVHGTYYTDHLWSLAVEEQFYLIWPLLLVWAIRSGGRRRAALLCTTLIVLSPVFRIGTSVFNSHLLMHRQGMVLPGRMDSLFAGALVAIADGAPRFEKVFAVARRFWPATLLFLGIVSPVLRVAVGNAYTFSFGYTFESLLMAACVLQLLRAPQSWASRMLGWRPAAWIGLISYSLYLYQSMLIGAASEAALPFRVFAVLGAILCAGGVSFYLVESPSLRLRARLIGASVYLPNSRTDDTLSSPTLSAR